MPVSASPTGSQGSDLDRGELAAGAVDVTAAGVADGGRDTARLEPADELALVGRVGSGPFRAGGGIEWDQVDVHPAPVAASEQHVGEQVGAPRLVVDAAHHGVLDRDAALGDAGIVP